MEGLLNLLVLCELSLDLASQDRTKQFVGEQEFAPLLLLRRFLVEGANHDLFNILLSLGSL